jgi:hypothetical protein
MGMTNNKVMKNFKVVYIVVMLLATVFLAGCSEVQEKEEVALPSQQGLSKDIDDTETESEVVDEDGGFVEIPEEVNTVTPAWMKMQLKDINSEASYTLGDFKGKSVLVESFAVWCPLCTQQQKESKKLHDSGSSIISISLGTDPNEEERIVKEHTQENGFTWRYSVSPKELTQALIDEFGSGVVNAPAVPVILICPDQSTRLLKRGVKSASKLEEEVAKGC